MVIKEVKIKKNRVMIICDDNYSFEISLESYMNNYVLIGDTISEKRIKELISLDEIDVIKCELINKISRKRLSKKECYNYLSSSNLKDEIVEKIIENLEKNHFINDVELAEAIIVSCLVNKKGRDRMKEALAKRYVSGNYEWYLSSFIDQEKYHNNICYLIDKYKKLGKKNSSKVLKQYIVSKLIMNGYYPDEFMGLITIEDRDEFAIVSEEIMKFFKIREANEQNIAKITKKLLSKGFNYAIIKCAIERSVNCEIN